MGDEEKDEEDVLERKRDVGRNAVQSVMHNSVIAHMAINVSRGSRARPTSFPIPTDAAQESPAASSHRGCRWLSSRVGIARDGGRLLRIYHDVHPPKIWIGIFR